MALVRVIALVVLAGFAVLPATAAARAPQPLVDLPPQSTHFQDRVIAHGPVKARAASAPRAYLAPDGTSILVRFSDSYTENPDVAQTYVNFLGSLPHGAELAKLSVLLAPPAEVQQDCGGQDGVLACYDGQSHEMVVPGEQTDSSNGVTTSYVIAHEYGHHIASYRSNPPFPTLDFGPKYWASYEKVCNKVLTGRVVPGAEGEFYATNPGENWAETYARLTYPEQAWTFTHLLKPDAGALAAARRDVAAPWLAPASKTFTGRFTKGGPSDKRFLFGLTLDGALKVKLHGPVSARYDLRVSSLGKTRGKTTGKAARDQLSWAAACRERRNETVAIRVLRRGASTGPFTVTVTYAG
jgi:hypothetical protein